MQPLKRYKSLVHLLVEHWLATPNLMGSIGCTLLVTRITYALDLLEISSSEYIDELRLYIGYECFRHAHLLKREYDGLHMRYSKGRIWLPNLEMGLYYVNSYHIEFQAEPVNSQAP